MASEFSVAIALAYEESTPVAVKQLAAIDVELQEVREVLAGLSDYERNGSCWCSVFRGEDDSHEPECQRARELMKRLEVK